MDHVWPLLLLLNCFLSTTSSQLMPRPAKDGEIIGTITVKLKRYSNPKHLLASGQKCDPGWFSSNKCDPRFTVCFLSTESAWNASGTEAVEACDIGGPLVFGPYDNAGDIAFGETMSLVKNPIVLNVTKAWRGVEMRVRVDEMERGSLLGSNSAKGPVIDNFTYFFNGRPSQSTLKLRLTGSTIANTSLELEAQIQCRPNYYDIQCSTYCIPRPEEHFTCHPKTGRIVCQAGWTGDSCSAQVLSDNLNIHPLPFGGSQVDETVLVLYDVDSGNFSSSTNMIFFENNTVVDNPSAEAMVQPASLDEAKKIAQWPDIPATTETNAEAMQAENSTTHFAPPSAFEPDNLSRSDFHEPDAAHSGNASAQAITSGVSKLHPYSYSTVWPLTVSLVVGGLSYLASTSPATGSPEARVPALEKNATASATEGAREVTTSASDEDITIGTAVSSVFRDGFTGISNQTAMATQTISYGASASLAEDSASTSSVVSSLYMTENSTSPSAGLNPWSDMSTDRMFDTATGSTRAWSIHSRNETNSETVEPLKITVAPRPSSTIKLRENYTAEFDATTTTTEVIAAAIEETSAESASGTNRIRNPDDEAEIVQLPEFTDGPDDLAGYEIVNVPATDMEPANTITTTAVSLSSSEVTVPDSTTVHTSTTAEPEVSTISTVETALETTSALDTHTYVPTKGFFKELNILGTGKVSLISLNEIVHPQQSAERDDRKLTETSAQKNLLQVNTAEANLRVPSTSSKGDSQKTTPKMGLFGEPVQNGTTFSGRTAEQFFGAGSSTQTIAAVTTSDLSIFTDQGTTTTTAASSNLTANWTDMPSTTATATAVGSDQATGAASIASLFRHEFRNTSTAGTTTTVSTAAFSMDVTAITNTLSVEEPRKMSSMMFKTASILSLGSTNSVGSGESSTTMMMSGSVQQNVSETSMSTTAFPLTVTIEAESTSGIRSLPGNSTSQLTSFLSFELGPDVRIFGNRVADSELLNQLNRTILEVVNQRVILQTPSVQSQITTAVEFTGLSVTNYSIAPMVTAHITINGKPAFSRREFQEVVDDTLSRLRLLSANDSSAATFYAGHTAHPPGIIIMMALLCAAIVVLLGVVIILSRSSRRRTYSTSFSDSDRQPSDSRSCSFATSSAYDNPTFHDPRSPCTGDEEMVSLEPRVYSEIGTSRLLDKRYQSAMALNGHLCSPKVPSRNPSGATRTTTTFVKNSNGGTL